MKFKKDYFGYIYLWFDTKKKMYYLGGHFGAVENSYICSSIYMKNAYKKRPQDFRIRVIEYITENSTKILREREQHYLNMIKDSELTVSNNVLAGTNRYYNMKKFAVGGNGKANKGNSNIGGWNKGLKGSSKAANDAVAKEFKIKTPNGNIMTGKNLNKFCKDNNLSQSQIHATLKLDRPILRGKFKGWQLLESK